MIKTTHYGDYESINMGYVALYKYIKSNNLTTCDSVTEVYLVDEGLTSNQNDFITEVKNFVKLS